MLLFSFKFIISPLKKNLNAYKNVRQKLKLMKKAWI